MRRSASSRRSAPRFGPCDEATGTVKVKVTVTYTPPGGPPMHRTLKIKLIQKRH
jgi:hypothetical protein